MTTTLGFDGSSVSAPIDAPAISLPVSRSDLIPSSAAGSVSVLQATSIFCCPAEGSFEIASICSDAVCGGFSANSSTTSSIDTGFSRIAFARGAIEPVGSTIAIEPTSGGDSRDMSEGTTANTPNIRIGTATAPMMKPLVSAVWRNSRQAISATLPR